MSNADSFFLPGSVADIGYANVRDKEHFKFARDFTESLWTTYAPYADRHARSNARAQFLPRFWEMYLACTLLDRNFTLERVGHEGPEFFFLCEGHRIWVEAIAPGPGIGENEVPEPQSGVVCSVPTDKILLRFTHALVEKQRRYEQAIAKGIVKPEDHIILAINSRDIPHAPYGAEMPYILKAFLPVGSLTYTIDRETLEISDAYHQHRENISKVNGKPVSTTSFLDPRFSAFSAVIHSGVDCTDRPATLGNDFVVLHNPTTTYRLPDSLFNWCQQFEFRESTIYELPRHPTV